MHTVHRGFWLSVLLAAFGLASPAAALTVGVTPSAGLDQGFGYTGCPSCSEVYALTADAAVGAGTTITFAGDLVGPFETVTISIVDVSSLFSDGAETVAFTDLDYSATVTAAVTPLGGGLVLLTQVGAATTGSVSGSYSASLGGAGAVGVSPDVHSLQCVVNGSGEGVCGFTFGPTSFPIDDGSQTLGFQHTFNLNLPEPATWMMMLVGLVGLGDLGRSRRGA